MSGDPAVSESRRTLLRAAVFIGACAAGAVGGRVATPTQEIAMFGAGRLENIVPQAFGVWRIDRAIAPVLPDPSTLVSINRIYSETLARTYVNDTGYRIMLSLAYGRKQNDTMRLHQPEGCYAGQGFAVRIVGRDTIEAGGVVVPVMRLQTAMGNRDEPVTYWMIIGGKHAITQFEGKMAQLSFGLKGYVPDGLLVRVSSISRDSAEGFRQQDLFVRDLVTALPPAVRSGFVGRT